MKWRINTTRMLVKNVIKKSEKNKLNLKVKAQMSQIKLFFLS